MKRELDGWLLLKWIFAIALMLGIIFFGYWYECHAPHGRITMKRKIEILERKVEKI